MTTAIDTALPEGSQALETAARHHLDTARGFLDDMNGVVGDPSHDLTARAFWQHMNIAWQLIHRVERGGTVH